MSNNGFVCPSWLAMVRWYRLFGNHLLAIDGQPRLVEISCLAMVCWPRLVGIGWLAMAFWPRLVGICWLAIVGWLLLFDTGLLA